eukprot:TRINITY_DN5345_c0_g1_i1.p1 TRINITY_DN5345_c0_g1~~TRINITY_DN5345_c0_g1_i1.p1  ORF type:complete len:294 (-),score=62.20 TRINITY_DN5345_c0_g1_i1:104-985(-)
MDATCSAAATADAPAAETRTPNSLVEYAVAVLNEGHPDKKAALTHEALKRWRDEDLPIVDDENKEEIVVPLHPARPDFVKIVPARDVYKRGKGGTLANRIALLHSIVHIESVAVDLSWDIIARFHKCTNPPLSRDFFNDWAIVAEDEARHYSLLKERMEELGGHYGDLPGHNGLWESAVETADDILARLAIEHMVHEARGLDVTSISTINKFRSQGDKDSANLLARILTDEITHVRAGLKWFKYVSSERGLEPIPTFHEMVRTRFRGKLKKPFSKECREKAGMTEEWYLPLSV